MAKESTPISNLSPQQPNGDIVVLSEAGGNSQLDYTQFALTRYTSTGALDPIFGTNGTFLTAFSTFTFGPFGLALEPNGELLVAGGVENSSGVNEFGLAQVPPNCQLDTTFGTDGVATAEVIRMADTPNVLLLQPNG
ncbi:MAG: hypothetical protein ABSF53_06050 [Terracidiphilus sp.]